MAIYRLKRFSKYDDTDAIKRMKDSDILAEKKKEPSMTKSNIAGAGLAGATVGLAGGAVLGAAKKGGGGFVSKLAKGGKKGAIIGGAIAAGLALNKRNQEKKDNQFYNNRLDYAKRQAVRREKTDWKQNNTQRDGYSY